MPVDTGDQQATAGVGADLNLAEARSWTPTQGLGAWCAGPQGLMHVSFYSAAAHREGLLLNFALFMAVRAAWVRKMSE